MDATWFIFLKKITRLAFGPLNTDDLNKGTWVTSVERMPDALRAK